MQVLSDQWLFRLDPGLHIAVMLIHRVVPVSALSQLGFDLLDIHPRIYWWIQDDSIFNCKYNPLSIVSYLQDLYVAKEDYNPSPLLWIYARDGASPSWIRDHLVDIRPVELTLNELPGLADEDCQAVGGSVISSENLLVDLVAIGDNCFELITLGPLKGSRQHTKFLCVRSHRLLDFP